MLRARTLLSRSPSALLSRLSRLPDVFQNSPNLFSLSTNVDSPALSELVTALTNDHGNGHARVGCLSGALSSGVVSCSIAAMDGESAAAFRSSLPGRSPTQVGRWHAIRQTHDEADGIGQEGVYEMQESSGSPNVSTIIYFSDKSPQGLDTHLRATYSGATQLGLLAASTPFVTGRPVTLFHNQRIHSSGAVGFELREPTGSTLKMDFRDLTSITQPATVTRSEGNLVYELDGKNPSKMLLAAIEKMEDKPDKDDEFFLGVLRDGRVEAIHNILSGDPSRGTMALEADSAPRPGETVQVFFQPRSPDVHLLADADFLNVGAPRVSFMTAPYGDASVVPRLASLADEEVVEMDDHFVAASESGWMLGAGNREDAAWKCVAVGAKAQLSFS